MYKTAVFILLFVISCSDASGNNEKATKFFDYTYWTIEEFYRIAVEPLTRAANKGLTCPPEHCYNKMSLVVG